MADSTAVLDSGKAIVTGIYSGQVLDQNVRGRSGCSSEEEVRVGGFWTAECAWQLPQIFQAAALRCGAVQRDAMPVCILKRFRSGEFFQRNMETFGRLSATVYRSAHFGFTCASLSLSISTVVLLSNFTPTRLRSSPCAYYVYLCLSISLSLCRSLSQLHYSLDSVTRFFFLIPPSLLMTSTSLFRQPRIKPRLI